MATHATLMRTCRRAACALIVATGALPAQTVRTVTLAAPTASFPEPFSRVVGIREQSDGHVVVLDDIERRIVLVDFRSGSMTPIGRQGKGPAEYTLPTALVALPGDTTLAIEMGGGGQALVITKDGAAESPLRAAHVPAGTPLFTRSDIQGDSQGRLYELVRGVRMVQGRHVAGNQSAVRRLDRRTGAVDTIGEISQLMRSPLIRQRPASAPPGARSRRVRGSTPPFASVDQWAVSPDGRIAFVTVDPYRVSIVGANGARIEGPPLAFEPIRVDARLKDQWRAKAQQPIAALTYGSGGVTAGFRRPNYDEPDEWPDVLPPFLQHALRFAPDGTLWIERATAAGEPQTFDLVDRAGVRTSRLILPRRTQLVGIGTNAVYTVSIDEDDLQYLERRPLPD